MRSLCPPVRLPLRCAGRLLFAFALVAAMLAAPASAIGESSPAALRFFEGKTERISVVKVVMKRPYRSRTISHGDILPDGSLSLVQQVFDEGKPAKVRRWTIRQVSPTRFTGSMSEAAGPVEVERIGDRYRFRLDLKGHLSVEEWLTPSADGRSAETRTIVRKWGIRVATGEGIIRRL